MNRNDIKLKKGIRPIYFKGGEGFTTKELDEPKREVYMILNSFGNKDDDRDIVQKGAFAKSLAERGVGSNTPRKIAYLKFHDMRMPLGTFKELWESDRGLEAIGRIDETPLGDETLIQMKNGTLNQHSIGFEYVWDKMDYSYDDDAFIVKELNLWEGSVVTIGVNENTPILEIRGKELEDIVTETMHDLEKHLKGIEYKSQYDIRRILSKLIALVEHTSKPDVKSTMKPGGKPQINQIRWELLAQVIKSQTIKQKQ